MTASTAARELAKLPRCNQVRAGEAVVSHSLSSRQVARLVPVLLSVASCDWAEILRDPLSHLKEPGKGQGPRPDPRLGGVSNRLRQELLRMHGAANRLAELFLAHPPASLPPKEAVILADLAGPIVVRVDSVLVPLKALQASAKEVAHGR